MQSGVYLESHLLESTETKTVFSSQFFTEAYLLTRQYEGEIFVQNPASDPAHPLTAAFCVKYEYVSGKRGTAGKTL